MNLKEKAEIIKILTRIKDKKIVEEKDKVDEEAELEIKKIKKSPIFEKTEKRIKKLIELKEKAEKRVEEYKAKIREMKFKLTSFDFNNYLGQIVFEKHLYDEEKRREDIINSKFEEIVLKVYSDDKNVLKLVDELKNFKVK